MVVFVPADFKTAFPSFVAVADASLAMAFDFATLQLNNGCGSRVCDAVLRQKLLNLLTAHIAAMVFGENGNPAPGIVGRIDKATEGSVSVSAAMDTSGVYGKDYYAQTQWGIMYWMSTARYRTMLYIPAPVVCADLAGMGPGWVGGIFPPDQNGGDCGC